jgi:uncharacterized protein YecE (DUF72 family)
MPCMTKGKAWIGTSGWHYSSWKGPFYPARIRSEDMLSKLAEDFRTVEVNNTFYHLVKPAAVRTWRNSVPKDFVFACKGSRYLTHMRKLTDQGRGIRRFFDPVEELGKNLGPILFQLPPGWKVNPERLSAFIDHLPKRHRYTFEFRNKTWFSEEVLDLLRRRNVALCIYHLEGYLSPIETTADFVYIRLHGPKERYAGSYHGVALATWAKRIASWQSKGMDVYCYFDNDQKARAPIDARRLRDKLAAL